MGWMKNRRKFPRREISIPCTVRTTETTFKAQIVNISLGGALITRLNFIPPPHGIPLQIEVEVVNGQVLSVRLSCTVVHTKWSSSEALFGVQFEEPIGDVGVKLNRILRRG